MNLLPIVILTLITVPFVSTIDVAADLPLQVGTYRRGISQSITIFANGSRICYLGTSNRGSTIASIKEDSKIRGEYRIYGMSGILINQNGTNSILFGSDNSLRSMDLDLKYMVQPGTSAKECLRTKKDFYKTESNDVRRR